MSERERSRSEWVSPFSPCEFRSIFLAVDLLGLRRRMWNRELQPSSPGSRAGSAPAAPWRGAARRFHGPEHKGDRMCRRRYSAPPPARFNGTESRADNDSIVYPRHAWRRPGGSLRLPAFGPRAHSSPQNDLTADGFDRDSASVDLSGTPQRILDLAPDFRGRDLRLHLDGVGDALHTTNPADRLLGTFPLVVPLDFSFERNPAAFHESPGSCPMHTAARS
jgi:hypothetical protein